MTIDNQNEVQMKEVVHLEAESARNVDYGRLTDIAQDYMNRLRQVLPEGCNVELGGSLRSNTALKGHNDIDIRVLLSEEWSNEEKIREISEKLGDIVPFQKVRPVGSKDNEKFAVMHQLNFEKEGIDGEIEIEVSVRPAEGYVGYAKFQESFPGVLLDQYVIYKNKTKSDKKSYKKVKEQFYAMTRSLHAQGYWDNEGKVVGDAGMLAEASKTFWGDNLNGVLSKDAPTI